MRLLKYWERFRSSRLTTLALDEQLESHRAAFYAGALAATLELSGVRAHFMAAAERARLLDELMAELTAAHAS